MTDLKSRVERLESEYRFRHWYHFERYMESLSDEQLESFATQGFFEGPQPEPLPAGKSKLDGLDRKRLVELCHESERWYAHFAAHSVEDQDFLGIHGHWPEEACGHECLAIENREQEM
jgi:hypothetical protein